MIIIKRLGWIFISIILGCSSKSITNAQTFRLSGIIYSDNTSINYEEVVVELHVIKQASILGSYSFLEETQVDENWRFSFLVDKGMKNIQIVARVNGPEMQSMIGGIKTINFAIDKDVSDIEIKVSRDLPEFIKNKAN